MANPRNPILYLIERKFRGLITDRLGRIIDPIPGPIRSEEQIELRRQQIDAYRKQLSDLPHDELLRMVDEEMRQEEDEGKIAEEGMFYNQPQTDVEIEHWAKMPFWTFEEAIALSLGKSPAAMRWENITPLVGSSPRPAN